MTLDRRSLLKALGASAVATSFTRSSGVPAAATETAAQAAGAWPGHQPGKVYLGAHAQEFERTLGDTGPLGVHRTFYQWNLGQRELRTITADHAARRLPWVSFKPPGGWQSWSAIGRGEYDADIRARARAYAEFSDPIVVTFHHEPTDDARSEGAAYSRAWCRVHDIMEDETGLQNVVSVPITTEWTFDPWNDRDDPADWATPQILERCHFYGIDTYHYPSLRGYDERVAPVLDYLDAAGHPDLMIGIGETAATDDHQGQQGADWWRQQWRWVESNVDRIGVVSYYNYVHPQNSEYNWSLWQSGSKLRAFRDSLASSVALTSLAAGSAQPPGEPDPCQT